MRTSTFVAIALSGAVLGSANGPKPVAEARRKKTAAGEASKQRKWQSYAFEIVELEKSFD